MPKWFMPVAVLALLWNLIGCAAYLSDVTITPEALAQMSAGERALYASRPAWAVAATAFAVWGGAAGCVALLLRRRLALPLFAISLVGLIGQDLGLFVLSGVPVGGAVVGMQAMVFAIAVALLLLARRAEAEGWLAADPAGG